MSTRTGPRKRLPSVLYAGAVLASHLTALAVRLDHVIHRTTPARERTDAHDRCPLCRHQLGAVEQRPPRDTRTKTGQVKRLPAEVLEWRRCGGCGLHQRGEPPRLPERGMAA